ARISTLKLLAFTCFTLFPERFGPRIKGAERTHQVGIFDAELVPPLAQRSGIGRLFRPEAAVASAPIRRAECATARLCDRAHTRYALRNHHAHHAQPFALHAH